MLSKPDFESGGEAPKDLKESVIAILKQQPGVPFSVVSLAELLRRPEYQIDIALEELEGPVDSGEKGAYLYLARGGNQAIYIP